jgi:Uma2 family endonuclease
MTLEEYFGGDYEEGYQYELIDGKLYVSPEANFPEDWVEKWLYGKVFGYSLLHPRIISYVTDKARIFVPGRPRATCPEPDLAAYQRFPLRRPIRQIRWQDVSPFLVGEILSLEDPNKDLVRNVELYLQVPSIKEYWLVDTRDDPERPTMQVRRRHGRQWRLIELAYGDIYTTRLLPRFELRIDPRS